MSTSINSLLTGIPKLDGSNYHDWVFHIQMVARRAGTWDVLSGVEKRPVKSEDDDDKGLDEWIRKDNDALTMIGLTVARSELSYIRDCASAYDMWVALASIYSRSSRANRIALRQQLHEARLQPDKPVQEYVNRIVDVSSRLQAMGVDMTENDEVDVMIMNLPEDWGHVASSLMIRQGDLKVKEVVAVLLEEELRRKHAESQTLAGMLARGGGTRGGAPGGRTRSVEHRVCYRCGERGHMVATCPAPAPKAAKKDEEAKVAVAVSSDDASSSTPRLYRL